MGIWVNLLGTFIPLGIKYIPHKIINLYKIRINFNVPSINLYKKKLCFYYFNNSITISLTLTHKYGS